MERLKYGIEDFSPESQDKFAVFLIKDIRKALVDIFNGNIESAILKTNKEWSSLPGSEYGQRTESMEDALNNYQEFISNELKGKSQIKSKEVLKDFKK